MTTRALILTAMIGGVWALGCRTPSSISGTAGPASPATTSSAVDWPPPATGKSFTLLPTPKTVVWGGYAAGLEPVLRVSSGDEVTVRALSTCNPTSLVRAGLDSSRLEKLARDIYAARDSLKPGPGGHILT